MHHIVALDTIVAIPDFAFDHTSHTIKNIKADPELNVIKDATIFITSNTPVPKELIEAAPNLQLIACTTVGTNNVDKKAAAERKIATCNVPAQSTHSVSEHAFALYYALRRRIVPLNQAVLDGTWSKVMNGSLIFGKMTRTNEEETLVSRCVIGYGTMGHLVESIGKALGMKVIIAERKGATHARDGRVLFETAIKTATVFIIVAPLNEETKNMIAEAEFAIMNSSALLINVGRGGIVNESAVVDTLKAERLAGYATDVFESEPADQTSKLLDPSIPNLIVTPHIAWYSERTVKGTINTLKANIEGFVVGRPQNLQS